MEVGVEIVHRLNKQLVVRISDCLKIRAKVVSENGKVVGRVTRVFGPVKAPYALLNMNENYPEAEKFRVVC